MADIVIFVKSMGQGPNSGVLRIRGIAHSDGARDSFEWIADVAINAAAAVVNSAIKDAAVATAAQAGVTVGALDAKTLFGGAVTL